MHRRAASGPCCRASWWKASVRALGLSLRLGLPCTWEKRCATHSDTGVAELRADGAGIVVGLSPLEKLGALRGDVRVPLSAVVAVWVSDDPWSELRGIRAPGTGVPGVNSLCTCRGRGFTEFAAVYGRAPAVVVELSGAEFDRLIISRRDAEATVQRLRGLR
jgi:hypothetical protein